MPRRPDLDSICVIGAGHLSAAKARLLMMLLLASNAVEQFEGAVETLAGW